MAGHVVALHLKKTGFNVDTLSANNALDKNTHLINVLDLARLKRFLMRHKYNVVVNCIGILVKESEDRKDLATYINSFLPHFLEHHYRDGQTRLIHLSTDCVFSGHNSPYREGSPLDTADNFYDRSKVLGEVINDKDLNLRLSIVGPTLSKDGSGLFNWFWQQTGEIQGFDK